MSSPRKSSRSSLVGMVAVPLMVNMVCMLLNQVKFLSCLERHPVFQYYNLGGMDIIDLRTGHVVRTLIPKIAEGIFDVIAMFTKTNEYVLYYHSGRKTVRVFRVKDGTMIANYRVPSDLSSLESTTDGISLVLGMVDGNLTVLTIADPKKERMSDYLKALPSRNQGQNLLKEAGF